MLHLQGYVFHSYCIWPFTEFVKEQVRDLTRFVPRGTSEDESRYELGGALRVHIVRDDQKPTE